MKKRVIIIHGWSGSPDTNWLPWLKSELEARGYEVLVPQMSHADDPVIDVWVSHLAEVVGTPDAKTYLVGHSIGCQTILRYLEQVKTPIGGAVFVAGWFNLENMESAEEEAIAKPWIENPIDLAHVRSVLSQSTLVISDNDPYGALAENKEKFASVVTKTVILHGAEHITEERQPPILEELLEITEKKIK